MIAPSFGDIFRQNSLKIGLLPVQLPAEQVKELMERARAGEELTVDLEARTAGGFPFELDDFARECLLEGLDDVALTLREDAAISGVRGGAPGADLDADRLARDRACLAATPPSACSIDFLLRQVEDVVVQLAQPFLGQRAAVRALEVLQHPLLAREIDEADPVLVLVPLQLRDEAQPLVHELDERAVEIGDLATHLQDVRIFSHGGASSLRSSWPS